MSTFISSPAPFPLHPFPCTLRFRQKSPSIGSRRPGKISMSPNQSSAAPKTITSAESHLPAGPDTRSKSAYSHHSGPSSWQGPWQQAHSFAAPSCCSRNPAGPARPLHYRLPAPQLHRRCPCYHHRTCRQWRDQSMSRLLLHCEDISYQSPHGNHIQMKSVFELVSQ